MNRDLVVSLTEIQTMLDRGEISSLDVLHAELKVNTNGNIVAIIKRSREEIRKS